ncbi:ABC transporter ATP-binding protein [Variovorax sp. YR216]|uniref:ABC transporter ATP-binding protein n=1 Tax=Variovorax sp. YR216 TaxID=1882828 RepID=UPI000899DB88|nr:ABC transporter ATP-binding protein [Variovorax sp. YR216]SEB25986.1 amino acid/amide ABC transporter ATP-binding protein 1, HAAT family [Variovorax sp. YR216]
MNALNVKGLSKSFGGVKAIQDLCFDVHPGTVHAIIGPNGAGKTTLINLVTGIYAPDSGSIELFGQRVEGCTPERLAVQGLSRTFQNLQVCMNMSAVDNVVIGAHLSLASGLLGGMLRLPSMRRADAACRERALDLMEFTGVAQYARSQASQLPYGALKRLEIARALAASPRLLLMDEPAAGLNHTETAEIELLIRRIAERGTTVVLVEHDMKLIMGASDRILVLHYGQRLALGTTEEIRNHPDVISAYLGAAA